MKNFLKQNWFKIVSLLFILTGFVVALSFYNTNYMFNKKEKCSILSNSYQKDEIKNRDYSLGNVVSFTGSPQFRYNKKFNSCFYLNYASLSSGQETANTEHYIIDLTTNEKVASYVSWDKGYDDYLKNEVYIENKKRFDELKNDIFKTN